MAKLHRAWEASPFSKKGPPCHLWDTGFAGDKGFNCAALRAAALYRRGKGHCQPVQETWRPQLRAWLSAAGHLVAWGSVTGEGGEVRPGHWEREVQEKPDRTLAGIVRGWERARIMGGHGKQVSQDEEGFLEEVMSGLSLEGWIGATC